MASSKDPELNQPTKPSNDKRRPYNGTGIPENIDTVKILLKQSAQTHLSEDDLMQYIEQKADDVLTARINGHIDKCRTCEARYYRLLMSSGVMSMKTPR